MSIPTKPGQRCRVIGGRSPFNGEGKSPNEGKVVLTVFLHDLKAGMEKENVWHCRSADGSFLTTYYGGGPEADFLECWLEVIDPDQETDSLKKEEVLNAN
jgi:hypothetical protein